MNPSEILAAYATLTADQLAAILIGAGRDFKAHDLIVEVSPTGRFRIVREGNTAHGILANRHQLIGLLVCLAVVLATKPTPDAFWKEVLS